MRPIFIRFYKICIDVWNPKSKNRFVTGQNSMTPSPVLSQFFTSEWEGLNTAVTRSKPKRRVLEPLYDQS